LKRPPAVIWAYLAHKPLERLHDKVSPKRLDPVEGTSRWAALARDGSMLSISSLLLRYGVDAAEAAAGSIRPEERLRASKAQPPGRICQFAAVRHQVAHPDYGAFMLKPLLPTQKTPAACSVGTDRFLISWLDITYRLTQNHP
jgi:hypothetical protein